MNRRNLLKTLVGGFAVAVTGMPVIGRALRSWHLDYIICDDLVDDVDCLYDVEGEYDHVSMQDAMETQKELNQIYRDHLNAHREALERTGLWPKKQ